MPLDLFLPFGGLLQSIFRLHDNSEAVGVRKESINDLAVVEASEIVELDDEDGVLGTGVESKSPALSPGYLLLRSPLFFPAILFYSTYYAQYFAQENLSCSLFLP